VEAMLGDEGRLTPLGWPLGSCDWRGILSDVRELLKEERRFVRLKSRRTPPARRGSCGEEEFCAEGLVVRKLSVLSVSRSWCATSGMVL